MADIRSIFATRLYQDRLNGIDQAELEASCLGIAEDDEAGQVWCEEQGFPGYTSYASLTDLPWRFPIFADLVKSLDAHVAAFAKFRKMHKGRIKGEAKGGSDLNFGTYSLKATTPERVTARQIEAARRAMTRQMKRQGRIWIRIFPDTPVTSKPTEVRIDKGKGSVDFWAAKVKPGRIMFEIDGG